MPGLIHLKYVASLQTAGAAILGFAFAMGAASVNRKVDMSDSSQIYQENIVKMRREAPSSGMRLRLASLSRQAGAHMARIRQPARFNDGGRKALEAFPTAKPAEQGVADRSGGATRTGSVSTGHSYGKVIKSGRDLFVQGDPCDRVHTLIDGWVSLYNIMADGRRQILQFVTPGAILGVNLEPGSPVAYSAQALTDVTVETIPSDRLETAMASDPELGAKMMRQLAVERMLAFEHIASIGRKTARERVAHLLLELFVRFQHRWPGPAPEVMAVPLTQEDVGDATGLTGVHVNRILNQFKSERILIFQYRKLRILNPEQLMEAAGVRPEMADTWTPYLK